VPFLSLASEARPQGLALADAVGTLSYTELRCRAEEVGRRLVTAGLRPGDLVAVKGTLDRDFVATLHGVWMAGGIVAPMSTRWTPFEEQQALHLLRPRMSYPPPLRATRGHETRRLEGFHFKLELPPPALAPSPSALPGLREGDTAAMLLTSGTSGSPRAVGLTVGNLMASARASRERLGLAPSDRWLGSLSPAHVGGLALLTRAAALGSGVVLRGAFRAETFLALAEEGAITHASLVPTMLHQVLAALGKGGLPRRCGVSSWVGLRLRRPSWPRPWPPASPWPSPTASRRRPPR
jgi:o-succinylbenzoate---CoA ligase